MAQGLQSTQSTQEFPLQPVVTGWVEKLKLARKHKKKKFQDAADEAMRFFAVGKDLTDWLWQADNERGYRRNGVGEENEVVPPSFSFVMAKVAELVQLFGPTLYDKNPVRQVTPRQLPPIKPELLQALMPPADPMDPMGQQMMAQQVQQQYMSIQQQEQQRIAVDEARADLLSILLNYTPNELDLKSHSRRVIDEALIKGMGTWWTELYSPHPAAPDMIGSFYETVNALLLDPDAETLDECQYVARECWHPIWEIERTYGYAPGELKGFSGPGTAGQIESARSQGESKGDASHRAQRQRGETNDLRRYWKVYSKMGMGDRLSGFDKRSPELAGKLDEFGDYVYLVIMEGVPYPLNMPPRVVNPQPPVTEEMLLELQAAAAAGGQPAPQTTDELQAELDAQHSDQILDAVSWPLPFWIDGGWPFVPLVFHDVPNSVWPMSHVAPGMPELKWLSWAMSFLANKVRTSCGTYIAIVKAAGSDLKTQLIEGGDNAVLELEAALGMGEGHPRITDLVSFLQQPPFHGDIWRVIEAVIDQLDKRLGLSEILYGQASSQSRSAADINVRQQNASIRVDDMANRVEESMTLLARREAIGARYLLSAEDVAPIMGPLRAQLWQQLVESQDLDYIARELEYRIESGSARKPNKSTRIDQINQAIQTWAPVFQGLLQMGNPGPINALIEDWGRAMDVDVSRYLIPLPPPPQPPPEQAEGQQPAQAA